MNEIPQLRLDTSLVNNLIGNMVHVDGGFLTIRIPPKQGYVEGYKEIVTRKISVPAFHICRIQITQEEWEAVMGSNPSKHKGAHCPVESVSWEDCQDFIKRLNSITSMSFRLPTEVEWEFAARGGNNTSGFTYSGGNNLDEIAWYRNNAFTVGRNSQEYGTHPVGLKQPNELGLYDMTGNVWEWCGDYYDYHSCSPLFDANSSSQRCYYASRGGGWKAAVGYCRVSRRIIYPSTHSGMSLGLRLAL